MKFLYSAILFLMVGSAAHVGAQPLNQQPNVLLIIADDMGLDASPCHKNFGTVKPDMPTLSDLCAQGVRFDNAWAAPMCSPTRASILTGRHGFRTGVTSPTTPKKRGINSNEVTLFDRLNEINVKSAAIGKWHLADQNNGWLDNPKSVGINYFSGILESGVKDYYQWDLVTNGKTTKQTEYSTSKLSDLAIAWLKEQNQQPWFLWLAYNAAHVPFQTPPDHLIGDNKATGNHQTYNQMLSAMDIEMGRVINSLPAKVKDNTIIIFVGDNGSPKRVAQGPLRAAKGALYEGGIRVPLAISGKNIISTTSNQALVNTTDLYATILSFYQLSSDAEDSISFSSYLTKTKGNVNNSEAVRSFNYSEITANSGKKNKKRKNKTKPTGWVITDGQFKLLVIEGQEEELFDLKADPYEKHNLLTNPTEQALAIQKQLHALERKLKGT